MKKKNELGGSAIGYVVIVAALAIAIIMAWPMITNTPTLWQIGQ